MTVGGYDAAGNALSRTDGHELTFKYDRAGRLTQVARGSGCTGTACLLKEFFYARTNQGTNRLAGKLYQAKRHNRVEDPRGPQQTTDFVVTETYRYEAPEGRLSSRRTTIADTSLDSTGAWSFEQGFIYDALGNLASETYPTCGHASCDSEGPARTVGYTWSNGLLTAVPGWANEISYHENGALAAVAHANGVTDTSLVAAHRMLRPTEIKVTRGASTLWTSGAFTYDEAGNVTGMGTDRFRYDQVSRLVSATVRAGGLDHVENYSYDRFGNLLAKAGPAGTKTWPVEPRSNRIVDPTWIHDAAGNLLADPAGTYTWDPLQRMLAATGTGKNETYLYTPDEERIAILDRQATPSRLHVTLRGLGAQVLRRYDATLATNSRPDTWTWRQDYVYRGSTLLASIAASLTNPAGTIHHFHLDHLGTPRVKTEAAGQVVAHHTYLPYGEELTDAEQDAEAMRFTVHERDFDPAGWGNDLDSMHARVYSGRVGRFLSVDPAELDDLEAPQSLNRYVYSLGNPASYVDPNGEEAVIFIVGSSGLLDNYKGIAGHAALAVSSGERATFVDSGGADQLRHGISNFINSYLAENRTVSAFILGTDENQDAALFEAAMTSNNEGVSRYQELVGNCATAVCETLRSAGVVEQNESPESSAFWVHTPGALESSLESGSLKELSIHRIDFVPGITPQLSPAQVPMLFGMPDDVESFAEELFRKLRERR